MSEQAKRDVSTRQRIASILRERGWAYDVPRNGVRRRVYCLAMERFPWWDWGHHLMILVGRDEGGNWSEPRPGAWWYRHGDAKRMVRTGYPIHPPSTYEVITDYETLRTLTEGLNEDEMYPWRAIYVDTDGALQLGRNYWGGTFYGLNKADLFLLRRYLRAWRRLDWFGLRSWLFSQALHAAVHRKKPGACNQVPTPAHGGYSHWACQLKRGHDGMHRFNAYTWGEIDGEPIGAHNPVDVA
jgi:hypothetical protein